MKILCDDAKDKLPISALIDFIPKAQLEICNTFGVNTILANKHKYILD